HAAPVELPGVNRNGLALPRAPNGIGVQTRLIVPEWGQPRIQPAFVARRDPAEQEQVPQVVELFGNGHFRQSGRVDRATGANDLLAERRVLDSRGDVAIAGEDADAGGPVSIGDGSDRDAIGIARPFYE